MCFCIVCGEELKDLECPACGWSLEEEPEPALSGQVAPAAIPKRTARSRHKVTRYPTQEFIQVVPPLVDFVLHDDGHTYALSEAIEGKAASLARWGDEGFECSVMLAIEKPIGVELLDDGSPIVIGGKGVAVNVGFSDNLNTESLPSTRGHRTGWAISCFAINPARNMLSLGVPVDGAVKGLMTGDFSENVLMEKLPGNPTALAFSRNGNLLATGCYSGEICVLNTSTRQTEAYERPGSNVGVVALAAISDRGWVAAYEDGQVSCWDASGVVVAEDALGMDITTVTVDVETERIAAGSRQGHIYVWEPMLEERFAGQQVHSDQVTRIIFRRNGTITVSAARSGEVSVMTMQ